MEPATVSFGMPAYFLLVAAGLQRIPSLLARRAFLAAILVYSLASLHAYYYIPSFEQARPDMTWVTSQFKTGDCLCFVPADEERLSRHWPAYAHPYKSAPTIQYQDFLAGPSICSRVWLMWDTRRGGPPPTEDSLAAQGLRLDDQLAAQDFPFARVWLYRTRPISNVPVTPLQ